MFTYICRQRMSATNYFHMTEKVLYVYVYPFFIYSCISLYIKKRSHTHRKTFAKYLQFFVYKFIADAANINFC